jgi:hypothetical protein
MHRMNLSDENLIIDCPVLSEAAPVVVGGVGGSGTRVIAQLLKTIGFDMGSDLNESLDDLGFTALFKRADLWPVNQHINELNTALRVYLTSRGILTPKSIASDEHKQRTKKLVSDIYDTTPWLETGTVEQRLEALSNIAVRPDLWGWKEPNTHILLPFLLSALPNLSYIHVIRDGRDMAHSRNKNQLALWGSMLLGQSINESTPRTALDYWCATHERFLKIAQLHPGRVHTITLESCVEKPLKTLQELLRFLPCSITPDNVATLKFEPKLPKTSNRHLNYEKISTTPKQRKLLEKFGYQEN